MYPLTTTRKINIIISMIPQGNFRLSAFYDVKTITFSNFIGQSSDKWTIDDLQNNFVVELWQI
jgi:hypothetical protein